MIEYVRGDDPRIAHYTAMTDVDARLRREVEGGFFMAEGPTVIQRALTARLEIVSTMCSPRWVDSLADMGIPQSVPNFVADEETLRSITGFSVHRGALAVFRRPGLLTIADVVSDARVILVLEDLVDHANVGAAFRSGAALGVDAVVLSPRCADPLYRRAVKTSMGASLGVRWARSERWPEDLEVLRVLGFAVWGMTPRESAVDLNAALECAPDRIALMVGTEGPGLTGEALAACDQHVRITMYSGVDSLNVAAASAVAVHAVRSALSRRSSS